VLPPFRTDVEFRHNLINWKFAAAGPASPSTPSPSGYDVSNIQYDSYLSTPNFVNALTDLSFQLIAQEDREAFLKQELKKINRHLPAAVYLPFVTGSIRNYAILQIRVEESRIFKTKERAPVLLCFEAYRPSEIFLETIPDPVNYLQRWL
jgi:hypothetical protein